MGTRKHYVLQSKATGKQASRPDQAAFAIKLKTKEINEAGHGGGIVDLLLPRASKEQADLDRVEQLYDAVEVTKRENVEREQARVTVEKELFLMVTLAELYLESDRYEQHKSLTVKSLTNWICDELLNHTSSATRLVLKHSPALADRQNPDWWQRRIALRRKNLKMQDAGEVKTES